MKTKIDKKWQILLIIVSLAGIVVMGYLLSLHYSVEEGAFCDLGEGLSCDIVNKSLYAKILGIPMSLLGMLYFIGILGLCIWSYSKSTLKKIAFLSTVFLGPSLYLSAIELFVLNNICVFCELSKVLIVGIILISLLAIRPQKIQLKNIAVTILLAVLLGGMTYFIQADTKLPDFGAEYDAFAQCLSDKEMRMYGSATCAFCARQRALFGDSFKYIQEIECDPRNPAHQSDRCIAKNIAQTPTWIQEDADGNDLHRFEPGVVSLEKLGEVTGCFLEGGF